ncbi:MAG: phenylacetate-CoA oxygenase subunit PaaJ [Proteobacteria bacterium]|nr:phenylacetate-CoA oxygenase subunit PaaJ [Pseudomonadota bacterium]
MTAQREADKKHSVQQVWEWLEAVPDPEIPVLSVVDLGIVRRVTALSDGVEVEVAPTYSGCPATEVIEKSIVDSLLDRGVGNVVLKRVLSPPWTTAWITDGGREKLRAYGIAPPADDVSKRAMLGSMKPIACPRCGATTTSLVSEFGSTPCKASYKCDDCLEPFEYFKCI